MRVIKEEDSQKPLKRDGKQFAKRKINWRRIIASFTLVISIVLLIGVLNYDKIQSLIGEHNQNAVINTRGKQKYKPNYDYDKVKPVSAASLAEAYKKRSNYKAVGQVAIPKLDINLNIYQGVGNTELNLGAGTMKPKQKMGQSNYCLAGHNMDDNKTFFSPLYSAKVNNRPVLKGMTVAIMNYKTVYYYTIEQAKFIKASDVYLLKDTGHTQISLFTCDYTGRGRLVVIGKYQYKQKLINAPKVIKQAFKKN